MIAAWCVVVLHSGCHEIPARSGMVEAAKHGPAADLIKAPGLAPVFWTGAMLMGIWAGTNRRACLSGIE